MPEYFSAYASNPGRLRQDLVFTVMIHQPSPHVLQRLRDAFPELRWTQGYSSRAPSGEYAFLPSAVPS